MCLPEFRSSASDRQTHPESLMVLQAILGTSSQTKRQETDHKQYTGWPVAESGKTLGMSRTKAYETWVFAEAWFAAWFDPADQ